MATFLKEILIWDLRKCPLVRYIGCQGIYRTLKTPKTMKWQEVALKSLKLEVILPMDPENPEIYPSSTFTKTLQFDYRNFAKFPKYD